jgi:hypothetical protein
MITMTKLPSEGLGLEHSLYIATGAELFDLSDRDLDDNEKVKIIQKISNRGMIKL